MASRCDRYNPIGDILASVYSEILGTRVVSYEQYLRERESRKKIFRPLGVDQIFRHSYQQQLKEEDDWYGLLALILSAASGFRKSPQEIERELRNLRHRCASYPAWRNMGDEILLRVKTFDGTVHLVRVYESDTVKEFKRAVESRTLVISERQQLTFRSEVLDDDSRISDSSTSVESERQQLTFRSEVLDDDNRRISDYGIVNGSTLHLTELVTCGSTMVVPTTFIDEAQFDHDFDFDFTNTNDDGKKFHRGYHQYYRPCGWHRYALKVRGKYEDSNFWSKRNDAWLGAPGYRESSTFGEWPVSYHGTKKENCQAIAEDGFMLSKGKRSLFGPGIYSTPSIDVAADPRLYAHPFDCNGKQYQVVFQNRVSTSGRKVIPKRKTNAGAEYWIQTNEKNIRPYGICVRLYEPK